MAGPAKCGREEREMRWQAEEQVKEENKKEEAFNF